MVREWRTQIWYLYNPPLNNNLVLIKLLLGIEKGCLRRIEWECMPTLSLNMREDADQERCRDFKIECRMPFQYYINLRGAAKTDQVINKFVTEKAGSTLIVTSTCFLLSIRNEHIYQLLE